MKFLLSQNAVYLPSHGGANKSNRFLLETLADRGHSCCAVTPATGVHNTVANPHDYLRGLGVEIAEQTRDYSRYISNGVEVQAVMDPTSIASHLQAVVDRVRPDWVIVSSEDPGQSLLRAALRKLPGGVVYMARTTLLMPFGPSSLRPSVEATELLRRTSGVIAVSQYLKEYMRRWATIQAVILPVPVYGPGPFPQLGEYGNEFVTMVNPCAIKGVCIFEDLARSFPEVLFAAVPTWGTTETDVRGLRRLPNVKLLLPVDDINQIFARTRILLVPSLWDEAFGRVVIEAMLCGIPVLASAVGGLPEAKLGIDYLLPVRPITQYGPRLNTRMIPEGHVPPQEIAPWKAALQRLLSDPVHYKQLSSASRNAALQFVSKLDGGQVEQYFEQLSRKGRPAGERARLYMSTTPNRAAELTELSVERRELLLRRLTSTAAHVQRGTVRRLARAPGENRFPLSSAQRSLWVVQRMNPRDTAYNNVVAWRLSGTGDIRALRAALESVVQRHEILRTTFIEADPEPVQLVWPSAQVPVVEVSLEEIQEREQRAELTAIGAGAACIPFDLEEGPILRAITVRLSDLECALIVVIHHISSDAWSLVPFGSDLALALSAVLDGREPAWTELPLQYADFAVWETARAQSGEFGAARKYWRRQLCGLPALKLQSEGPTGAGERGSTGEQRRISAGLLSRLEELSRREGVTLFITLLAALKAVLHRYTGQADLAIGTPVANRINRQLELLIGLFVNTVVIRTDLSGNPSFRELLQRLRAVCADGYRHQLPFEEVVEELQPDRIYGKSPLFQVMFAFHSVPTAPLQWGPITVTPVTIPAGGGKFDITVIVRREGPELSILLRYRTEVFAQWRIKLLLDHYMNYLSEVAVDPGRPILDIPLFTAEEQRPRPAGAKIRGSYIPSKRS